MPIKRIINHLCVKGRINSINSEINFTSESKKQDGIKYLFIILKSQCTLKKTHASLKANTKGLIYQPT